MLTILIAGSAEKFENYRNAVACAGEELALSVRPVFTDQAPPPVSGCDGLLLPGGGDVDPALYGEEDSGQCFGIDRTLDEEQLALLRAFVNAEKPVLGICRGMQLINVAFGGTLTQHLPTAETHRWDEVAGDKAHPVLAEEGSVLAALYGQKFVANSAHHQAVKDVAPGFRVTARAQDGVIEAMEDRTRHTLAVQFHPERMCYAKRREDTVDGSLLFRHWLSRLAGKE